MRILFAILLTASLIFTQPVFAEEFVLHSIGAFSTQGKWLNQWWYESQRVIFKGSGSRGANIDVTLDGKFNTVKADVNNGLWQFDAGTISASDHSVIIASGDQSHSFILSIGSAPSASESAAKGEMPTAGSVIPVVGIIGLAGGLIIYSFKRKEA
jgi:hypothetical protein